VGTVNVDSIRHVAAGRERELDGYCHRLGNDMLWWGCGGLRVEGRKRATTQSEFLEF